MISIIMPVYNAQEFLRATISSVLAQSFRDFELIAVNDGSTDSSPEILSEFASSDERIRIISQSNSGPSRARNNGIANARGEWFYFMDSDDILDENALMELTRDTAGADLIVFGLIKHIYSEDREKVSHYRIGLPDAQIGSPKALKDYLERVIREKNRDVFFSYIWNKLIRADVIRKNHLLFNEEIRLGEDFVFITEVLRHVKQVKVTEHPYYHYFVRGTSSLVGKFYRDELERRKLMYGAMTGLFRHYGLYEKCRDTLEVNEGRTSLICMGKINYPTCTLSEHDRIRFIDGFLGDERRGFMARYLERQGGKRNRLKSMMIRARLTLPVYLSIRRVRVQ